MVGAFENILENEKMPFTSIFSCSTKYKLPLLCAKTKSIILLLVNAFSLEKMSGKELIHSLMGMSATLFKVLMHLG